MNRRRNLVFAVLIAIVYLIPFPYLQAINNPNENTRTYLVMALVDDHTWSLDGVVARYGWTNDMASVPDPSSPNGAHLAAVKGPATAYLGVPVYAAQRLVMGALGKSPPTANAPVQERQAWLRTTTLVLQLVCAHLPGLAFLIWFERRLREWSRDDVLRGAAVVTVGLGTNYLAYSLMFVSHALIGAASFVAIDTLMRARSSARSVRGALVAGLAAGAITLLEYPALFVSAVIGVYAMWTLRSWLARVAFAIGAAVNAALLMLFQWGSFGNPLTPGHRMMQTQEFKALSEKGFFTLGAPDLSAAIALLFDRTFGLFATSPFLLLSTIGLGAALVMRVSNARRAAHRSMVLLSWVSVSMIVLAVSASVIWRGGWTIGPRYLGVAPALLATAALFGLETLSTSSSRRWMARCVASALALASFVQIGLISLVVTTLPEGVTWPVAEVFLPFVQLRLLPHHLLESIGIQSAWPWWVALGAAVIAALWPMLRARNERWMEWAARCVGAIALTIAITHGVVWPASTALAAHTNASVEARTVFADAWEPTGRDLISEAKLRAKRDPCAWKEVAALERVLGRGGEVARALRAAGACPR